MSDCRASLVELAAWPCVDTGAPAASVIAGLAAAALRRATTSELSCSRTNSHGFFAPCGVAQGVDGGTACGFAAMPAPADQALQAVLNRIVTRPIKVLTRLGQWLEE